MKTYKVKKGDSLSRIAQKVLGSAAKWREIQNLNGIPDPTQIKVGQVLLLPEKPVPEKSTRTADVIITEEDGRVFYQYEEDSTKRFLGKLFKKGLYRVGSVTPEDFITQHRNRLIKLKMSKSEINAMLATAENEGNLDAINTWDNSFISVGMFQWTLGQKTAEGELPALVKLVQQNEPDAFEQYCGQFGVKPSAGTNQIVGHLIHKGSKIDTVAEKEFFRSHSVAYRFAIAGTDERVNAVQIMHAVNRFDQFHFKPESKLGGFSVNQLLSSEYAAALLLDNHVNRPAYVVGCVAEAVKKTKKTFEQLAKGTDKDELNLIKQYLKIREDFGRSPMTDSINRALVTKRYLDSGLISAKRGSFKSNSSKRQ